MSKEAMMEMNRLRELAEQSRSAHELVAAMKQENLSNVKNALLEWMREEDQEAVDGGLIGEPGVEITYTDEGIRINKNTLDNSGLTPGDKLRLGVENGRVTLTRA